MYVYASIIIIFVLILYSMLVRFSWFLIKDFHFFVSVFTETLHDFYFFQNTSDYLISCLLCSISGKTTTILDDSTFTRPRALLHSF